MSETQDWRSRETLVGNSPAIRRIYDQLQKAALTEVPVLITGESGTGKGLAAKLLYNMSERRAHNFLKLSCAALSSRFFDWDFRNDSTIRKTAEEFEVSEIDPVSCGTLFLDEISELDLALQGKLLHHLQDSRPPDFSGDGEPPIDVRLICATSRDPETEIARGNFRADLYYRINVLRIHMPSLRDCIADVPLLMRHFIKVYSRSFGKTPVPMGSSFTKVLEDYHWPGNTRELENMAKRYVVMGGEEYVLSMIRPCEVRISNPEEVDLTTPLRVQTKRALLDLESKIILGVLKAHNWNRRKAARSLNISYRTLLYKIKEGRLPRSNSSSLP